ncbi:MAG: hypothetical protein ABJ327_25140 [Litoreibacter sp.]
MDFSKLRYQTSDDLTVTSFADPKSEKPANLPFARIAADGGFEPILPMLRLQNG